jgi:ribulose bisphosphate carboxylase small subunit
MVKILIKLGSRDDLNLANRTLEDLAPKVEACEQKYRDGFLLSRIKLGIAEGTNPATIRDLIEDVVSGDVLADLVNFLTSADRFVLKAILERAKKLESSDEILSSILHQIVTNAKTKNELRETYEMMIADDALNGRAMSTDQLQFFMAKAWNTGVQLIKARRGKEAEWWLARAIEIMRNDAGLVDLYRDDLEERYAKFLEHENTRIALQF